MDSIHPIDHAEAVAVFRSQVIGPLVCRDLGRGELKRELRRLSLRTFRPPGAAVSRTYSVPTLERWFYAWGRGGLEALKPRLRSDRGRAKKLSAEQRQLLLDIRREHPSASARLILGTLVAQGRIDKAVVSSGTVRRLFADHGLDRISVKRAGKGRRMRLRWQAEQPGVLWHGDVCHGPSLYADGRRIPLRIHALLDDASRRIMAIEAHDNEREAVMLEMFAATLRRAGKPDALFLDNGATYSGEALATMCARLGVSLLHARPYDPEARGKMERWWRTAREGSLDFLGACTSLHDVNVRLQAFVDEYHRHAHAGLMGNTPDRVWGTRQRDDQLVSEDDLRQALTARKRRRVRRDSTLAVDGIDFEVDGAFLAGRLVTVGVCLLDRPPAPWIEHGGKRFELHPVDPVRNAKRRRSEQSETTGSVPFDPAKALLDRDLGRTHHRHDKEA